MKHLPPQPDPIGTFQRKAKAARHAGEDARCACGETRPEALVKGSSPRVCAECSRKMKGHTIMDDHHVAGRRNSPITVPVPANDHRALLSPAQYDWPRETLENPRGCPLLVAAALIRGSIDIDSYLIDEFLRPTAHTLESLSPVLAKQIGPRWWRKRNINRVCPKGEK
jgi:hypothetical protein